MKRRVADVRAALRVGNRLAEEWYRQWLAWRWQRSGAVVVFDRHFFVDYHAYDVDEAGSWPIAPGRSASTARSWVGSTRGPISSSISMRPATCLLARKGEGTVEALERRRGEYRAIAQHVPDFVEVDATAAVDEVDPARRGDHRIEAARTAVAAGGDRMTRDPSRRHVLITDAGRGSAVAFIRSLGRRGWKVTAADHDPASAGFRSRYTTKRLLYPRPSEHPDAVVDAIRARVERDGIDPRRADHRRARPAARGGA